MRRIALHMMAPAFLSLILSGFCPTSKASPRVVRVFVALADNQHQGIIPVPAALGNGSDPQRNLYWGAAYGVKSFFRASKEWELIWSGRPSKDAILERCIFKNHQGNVFFIADAYEGSQIKLAVSDFLSAAAGGNKEEVSVGVNSTKNIHLHWWRGEPYRLRRARRLHGFPDSADYRGQGSETTSHYCPSVC